MRSTVSCGSNCNALMPWNVEHLFIGCFANCIIFFGEMSVQIFCPFYNWVVCFLTVEFQDVLGFWFLMSQRKCPTQRNTVVAQYTPLIGSRTRDECRNRQVPNEFFPWAFSLAGRSVTHTSSSMCDESRASAECWNIFFLSKYDEYRVWWVLKLMTVVAAM